MSGFLAQDFTVPPVVNVAITKPTVLPLKIDVAVNGTNVVLPAVPGKAYRIVAMLLQAAGTVNLTIRDTDLLQLAGVIRFHVREGVSNAVEADSLLIRSAVGKGIVFSLSAGVQVTGMLSYVEEP